MYVKRSKKDPPSSPAWIRGVLLFGAKFPHRFWHAVFVNFLDFGSLLGSILAPFSIILASLFRASFSHRFLINFGTDLNTFVDVFS